MKEAEARAEEEVRRLEEERVQAIRTNDADTLNRIQAENYLAVDPLGEIITKAQDQAVVRSGMITFDSIETDQLTFRTFGQTIIIVGFMAWQGRFQNFDISGQFRYSAVYARKQGHCTQLGPWQIVTMQLTRITPRGLYLFSQMARAFAPA